MRMKEEEEKEGEWKSVLLAQDQFSYPAAINVKSSASSSLGLSILYFPVLNHWLQFRLPLYPSPTALSTPAISIFSLFK